MKKLIFILLLFITFSGCNIDEDHEGGFFLELLFEYEEKLYNYNGVSESKKQTIWLEEFNDNELKFPFDLSLSQNDISASISNGILTLNYSGNRRYLSPIPVIIDEQKNYEIEVIIFIASKMNNKNLIEFSSSGNPVVWLYGIDKIYIEGNKISYKHPTGKFHTWKTEYNEDSFNSITIRKINNKIAFFINRILFAIMEGEKFSCNETYIVFNQGVNRIDYIKASYLSE